MRLVFCLFYPTIHPTNHPTIFCIKVCGQKIRHYILCIYLQYSTIYSAYGWGSWIRKERNSDCSPQAQSRQQRMTESEANCCFKKVPYFADFSPKTTVFCTFSETISPFFPNLVSPIACFCYTVCNCKDEE